MIPRSNRSSIRSGRVRRAGRSATGTLAVGAVLAAGLTATLGPAAAGATASPAVGAFTPAGTGAVSAAGTGTVTPTGAGNRAGISKETSLGVTETTRDMLLAGGKVWVSSGNEVGVFSTAGKRLGRITGLLGAAGLIASADGKSVHVAVSQDARIATLSTSTMTQTASWATGPCPTHLALAGGRIFYGYGCDGWNSALSSVGAGDGSAGPVLLERMYSPPVLRTGGNILVAAATGAGVPDAHSFTVAADGTATPLGSGDIGHWERDFAVSPDGRHVLSVEGYGTLQRVGTTTFLPAGTFEVDGWPSGVAYSRTGSSMAGASDGTTDRFRVFSTATGANTSRSTAPTHPAGGIMWLNVLPGTLQYSVDGSSLYGLVDRNGTAALVRATTKPIAAGKVTITSVTSPKKYGQKATVRVTGRPKVTVTVTTPGSKSYRKKTNASGKATVTFTPKYSGKITAGQAGDLTHAAATSAAKSLRTPARLSLAATGSYSSKGGVRHYRSFSLVRVPLTVKPDRVVPVTAKLQAKISGKWQTVQTLTGNADNDTEFWLETAPSGVKLRYTVSFSGDSWNSKAPTATSPVILID